jgi:hypothetical protein
MSEGLTTGYDHMHRDGFPLKMDIDTLAEQIIAENYGFVRFQAALCRAMRKQQVVQQAYQDERRNDGFRVIYPMVDSIEDMIRQGDYR